MTLEEKGLIDGVSISTAVGTLVGLLPALAALLSVVWSLIRIYETDTVRKYLKKRKETQTE